MVSTAARDVLFLSIAAKVLLFPAYRSTDFEVHRNWLAITHSLPLAEWYQDTTSEWTLDYPPFFAYFEALLSKFAYIVDPAIVRLDNLGYSAWSAVAFQRSTVIVSELVLAGALWSWARRSKTPDYPTATVIAASVLLHPGLMMVDHIHFQYNGFLLGILLWAIIAAREERLHLCAVLFAALLNFKHIFMYIALPFFVFLLRRHCFDPRGFRTDKFVELGLIVGAVFALSFGPFIVAGGPAQLGIIFARLFPFQRGLNHAYWAPNAWALLTAVDRVLVKYLLARGWPISSDAIASSSRGLVGDTAFGVLPTITPRVCFAVTAVFGLAQMVKLWRDPSYRRFLEAVVLAALTSFLFGWHVHEKAILLALVPMSLIATADDNRFRAFVVASVAGTYALFPLLIHPAETPVKVLWTLVWFLVIFRSLRRVVYRPMPGLFTVLVQYGEILYLAGFVAIHLYVYVLHDRIFPGPLPTWAAPYPSTDSGCTPSIDVDFELDFEADEGKCLVDPTQATEMAVKGAMEFLPLMVTSVYCAAGVGWAWVRLSWGYFTR